MNPKYELGICKFKNIDGISCYMVSILHILQQIPHFADYIISYKFFEKIKNKVNTDRDMRNLLIIEMYRLLKTSYENDNYTITPTSFKKLIGKKNSMWLNMEHQDSQEFLIFLISTLEEELGEKIIYIPNISIEKEIKIENIFFKINGLQYLQKSQKNDFSIIKKIFIGIMINTINCKYCKTKSPCFESFITLPLSIPINNKLNIKLYDCLNYLIRDEILDKQNMVYCSICGLKNSSTKKTLFWKSPKVLIIQLKRFIFDLNGNISYKNNNNIEYPINDLDIKSYFHPESPFIEKSIYNLIGINIHSEIGIKNINAGHYVSIVKNRYNNQWYLFNDSHDPILINNNLQNNEAYLLFYYRKN